MAGMMAYRKDSDRWEKEAQLLETRYRKNLEIRKKKISEKKKPVENVANKLRKAIFYFYKARNEIFKMEMLGNDSNFTNACNTALGKMNFEELPEIKKDMSLNAITNWKELKKHYMRKAVCLFLSEADVASKANNRSLKIDAPSPTVSQNNLDVEVTWMNLINSMVSNPKIPKTAGDRVKEWRDDTWGSLYPENTRNRHRWKVGVEGKILLSDNSGKTVSFGNDGLVNATENVTFTDKSCDQLKLRLAKIGTNVE